MSVRYKADPLGLAATSPTVSAGRERMLPTPRQLGAAAVQTVGKPERLMAAVKRQEIAEKLVSGLEKGATHSRAPASDDSGLMVHWMPATSVSWAGFRYYSRRGRMTREEAVRWEYEDLERRSAQRDLREVQDERASDGGS